MCIVKRRPDFIKCHCTNTDLMFCADCPRDFLVSLETVSMIAKNGEGHAVLQTMDGFTNHPLCGIRSRNVKTLIPFDELVEMIKGKVLDVGDTLMVNYQDTIP